MWTQNQFKADFGRTFNPSTDSIALMNADGAANSSHIEGATYQGDEIFAVFDNTATNSQIRVNYIVVLAA